MAAIAESELIINERGAIYHLNLRPEELARTIIIVGDPHRVKEVTRHFDSIELILQHREFVTHTGYFRNKRISVVSTGIGTDNVDIVLNEIDALLNIDLDARVPKSDTVSADIIRIGTSGSLQKDIPVDSFVASTHGLGIDNLMNFYRHDSNEEEKQLLHAFVTQTQLHNNISYPYIGGASASLLRHFVPECHHGITVTCPGFYGPQGRVLRLGLSNPELVDRLTQFSFGQHRITNFEMETAALYGIGKLLGHRCLSLNAIIANRVTRQFTQNSAKLVDRLIRLALERISSMNH